MVIQFCVFLLDSPFNIRDEYMSPAAFFRNISSLMPSSIQFVPSGFSLQSSPKDLLFFSGRAGALIGYDIHCPRWYAELRVA